MDELDEPDKDCCAENNRRKSKEIREKFRQAVNKATRRFSMAHRSGDEKSIIVILVLLTTVFAAAKIPSGITAILADYKGDPTKEMYQVKTFKIKLVCTATFCHE